MRRKLQVLLLLPLLTSGCVTHKLWTESRLDEWNEPAANPNLRLFADTRKDDVLVVYDEYSERHATTRQRAFFLQKSQASLQQHARPHFVNVRASLNLSPVPVFCTPPAISLEQLYAITSTNCGAFTLFSGGHEIGAHELPVYNDGVGPAERIALTPVAASVDATVIGGMLGCLYVYAIAGGNEDASWRGW